MTLLKIFSNEKCIICLIGAVLLEQNDEWAVLRARYLALEITLSLSDNLQGFPTVVAARHEHRSNNTTISSANAFLAQPEKA